MADVYAIFGADTGALEAGAAVVKTEMQAVQREMQSLAREMRKAGAAADSDMAQSLKDLGNQMAEARAKSRDLNAEIAKAAGPANDNFKNLSGDFKRMTEAIAANVYELSPWTGQHVEMAKMATLALANALGVATLAFSAVTVATTAAIVAIGAYAANLGDTTGRLAAEFGQTTEGIGALGAVAGRVGLETDALGKSLAELQKNAANTDHDDEGFRKTEAALKSLGLTVDSVKGKNFQQVLETIAAASEKTGNSAFKTQALVALFGEEVAERLTPALNRGAGYMRSWADAAEQFGVALAGDVVQRMQGTKDIMAAVGDAVHRLGMAFKSFAVAIYTDFKGPIDGLLQIFADLIDNIASAVGWFSRATTGSGVFATAMTGLSFAMKAVVTSVALAIDAFSAFATVAVGAVSIVSDGITGLARLTEAFFRDLAANSSSVFATLTRLAMKAVEYIASAFVDLGEIISSVFGTIVDTASAALSRLRSVVGAMGSAASEAFNVPGFTNTQQAFRNMTGAMSADWQTMNSGLVKIAGQAKGQIDAIWGEKKRGNDPRRAASDPTVPDSDSSKGKSDALRDAQVVIQGQIDALRAGLEQKKLLIDESVKLKLLSDQEGVAATRAAVDEEYRAERELLAKEMELEGLKASQKDAIRNKMRALDEKHAQETLKLEFKNVEQIVQVWHKMIDTMAQSLSSSITGMITGSKKLVDAVRDIAKSIINEFVQMGVKVVADWAKAIASKVALSMFGETQTTAALTAGIAARQAAETTGEATSIATKMASILKSIAANVGEVFAGTSAFLAPVMGPAAPGVAAGVAAGVQATATAFVPGYDIGAWKIDQDQVGVIHRNEMVMTAAQSGGLRNVIEMARGAMTGGDGSAGGDFHLHYNQMGRIPASEMKAHARMLADEIGKIWSGSGRSLRPVY